MNDRIILQSLPLMDLKCIKRNPIKDHRGFLERFYCQQILKDSGIPETIAQINLTSTYKMGTVRGMHFQFAPFAETKIVSCLRGQIFDVALDLREDSPTFLKWHGEILSPILNNSLLIPKGFAHGFQTLSDNCELLYFHTASYNREAEGGIFPFDPLIKIDWPLEITEISERDKNHPLLSSHFKGIKI